MTDFLISKHILIVEDIYLIGMVLAECVRDAGGTVAGPYATCAGAVDSLEQELPDAAILDIGLSDGPVYPLARVLSEKGVPYVFATGCGPDIVPDEFAATTCLTKPVADERLCEAVLAAIELEISRKRATA